MAKKNNSSQMKDCLTQSDVPGPSQAQPNQQTSDDSSSKRKHSDSTSFDPTDVRQRPGAEAQSRDILGEGKLKKEPECHLQLERLSANMNHTVLIHTGQFQAGKMEPYQGRSAWDNLHVKLPHEYPKNAKVSRWEVTQRALKTLTRGHCSVQDVEAAIKTYNQTHKRNWHFDTLYSYTQRISRLEDNFSSVIPKMAKLALKLPDLIKHCIPLLKKNHNHAITMSQEQISCLLANAFFCSFPHRNATHPGSEYANFPTINFSSLFADGSQRKIEKLRALFHYFNTVTEKDTKPDGLVTFRRICLHPSEFPDWNKQRETMTNLHVYSKGFIEKQGKGMLQVDFAARSIGGGVLGQGLVQEEILFMQCPELIVARLFTEKLEPYECLKITGAQMYSITSGYSDNFEWVGPCTDCKERDEWKRHYRLIVAIDAMKFDDPREQFTEQNIRRELLKAYVGFRKDPGVDIDYTPAIATGNWGCGAFKGDSRLKALIQMMAAAVAQRDLAYFTFDDKDQAEELYQIYRLLKDQKVTVGKLYNLLQDYCKHYKHDHAKKNVFAFIREKIGVFSSQL